MTSSQKVIKGLAIALAVFIIIAAINFILLICGHFSDTFVKRENITYNTYDIYDVSNLSIDLSYTSLNIKEGNTFKLELNNFTEYNITNNTLYIKDVKKIKINTKGELYATLYVPYGKTFDNVSIDSGAGVVKIDTLKTNILNFDIGAGKVTIDNLDVYNKTKIDGGAGSFEINKGNLANVDFDMGVGSVSINSTFTGNGKIDMGVGNLSIKLLDSFDNYKFDVEKGIGNINIDGTSTKSGIYGNGNTFIEIDGGLGNINIH